MMMKTLLAQFAPFLSFLITTQDLNSHTVIIFSGAAPPGSKCLDIRDPVDRLTNGTVAQIWDCNGDVTENWEVGPPGSRNREIKIAGTNMCLDAGNTNSPSNLVLLQCNGSPQQQWIHTKYDQLAPLSNLDLCLDLPNSSTKNEGQVLTYPCNRADSQVWGIQDIN